LECPEMFVNSEKCSSVTKFEILMCYVFLPNVFKI
jgi:hypothetical protein